MTERVAVVSAIHANPATQGRVGKTETRTNNRIVHPIFTPERGGEYE